MPRKEGAPLSTGLSSFALTSSIAEFEVSELTDVFYLHSCIFRS